MHHTLEQETCVSHLHILWSYQIYNKALLSLNKEGRGNKNYILLISLTDSTPVFQWILFRISQKRKKKILFKPVLLNLSLHMWAHGICVQIVSTAWRDQDDKAPGSITEENAPYSSLLLTHHQTPSTLLLVGSHEDTELWNIFHTNRASHTSPWSLAILLFNCATPQVLLATLSLLWIHLYCLVPYCVIFGFSLLFALASD